jgi:hypothetical protein
MTGNELFFCFLDAESSRKYPAVTHLLRQSLEEYTFSGTKVRIPKGQMIWIPVQAIHLDPALYPDPLVFDPERFSKANEDLRNSVPYLAFGDGPRNCIGNPSLTDRNIASSDDVECFQVPVSQRISPRSA